MLGLLLLLALCNSCLVVRGVCEVSNPICKEVVRHVKENHLYSLLDQIFQKYNELRKHVLVDNQLAMECSDCAKSSRNPFAPLTRTLVHLIEFFVRIFAMYLPQMERQMLRKRSRDQQWICSMEDCGKCSSPGCDHKFSKSTMARQLKENHPDKFVDQCKECTLRPVESNLKCPDCGDLFADPHNLKRPVQRMHRADFWKEKSSLQQHMKKKGSAFEDGVSSIQQPANIIVSKGQAKTCFEDKPNTATLQWEHMQRRHGQDFRNERRRRPYKCTVEGCSKEFYSQVQLLDHGNTQSNLKFNVCAEDGCQRAYCCRSSLQQHMKKQGVSFDNDL
ncbi:hypothetical protein T11_10712 [Trichinella zimbabwensis]|uniref:C2H2-type domain-containing protein n=1 Tax=Trichinella zimbabwensis TaxID=268475 RepID=A0A0V1GTV6_9BILA|nr:hypothetical protein T11_10712 [Trichinella zimbabwensis]